MTTYLQSAFHAVCKEATAAEGRYLALMERAPFYGGPEEGGWWGEDVIVVAYQHFDTTEAAEEAQGRVEALAKELEEVSRQNYGRHCLCEMDWLEARGLDADWLPEPDGPSEFYVTVTEGIPEGYRGCRQYS